MTHPPGGQGRMGGAEQEILVGRRAGQTDQRPAR